MYQCSECCCVDRYKKDGCNLANILEWLVMCTKYMRDDRPMLTLTQYRYFCSTCRSDAPQASSCERRAPAQPALKAAAAAVAQPTPLCSATYYRGSGYYLALLLTSLLRRN